MWYIYIFSKFVVLCSTYLETIKCIHQKICLVKKLQTKNVKYFQVSSAAPRRATRRRPSAATLTPTHRLPPRGPRRRVKRRWAVPSRWPHPPGGWSSWSCWRSAYVGTLSSWRDKHSGGAVSLFCRLHRTIEKSAVRQAWKWSIATAVIRLS